MLDLSDDALAPHSSGKATDFRFAHHFRGLTKMVAIGSGTRRLGEDFRPTYSPRYLRIRS